MKQNENDFNFPWQFGILILAKPYIEGSRIQTEVMRLMLNIILYIHFKDSDFIINVVNDPIYANLIFFQHYGLLCCENRVCYNCTQFNIKLPRLSFSYLTFQQSEEDLQGHPQENLQKSIQCNFLNAFEDYLRVQHNYSLPNFLEDCEHLDKLCLKNFAR
ncbi:CLUMA_CG008582, isoform A [Clunio marinus]|uniref:CLUMA_CG008582, isoform A n=1 Tax=Clunio marinus TaxID=568069 RepID=A0A1J1I472_9DIPT|nr:CLUMA_CG008582, isoform A [Clunio marinus]